MGILEKILDTQEFATLPPVATRILNLLEDMDVDIRDISDVIETDPSLTLKLLRVANSPIYAVRNEISSIHQAVITMGLNRLTNIVLGVSIFSKFLLNSQQEAAELMEKYWWHSSCSGMVAKALCVKLNKHFKENEFIGGLLHEIGKLALIQHDPKKYKEVIELIEGQDVQDIEAENMVFEIDHTVVGAEIAKQWNLPNDISTVISHHTNPAESEENIELISIVRVADLMCEMWGAGFYEGIKVEKLEDYGMWGSITESIPYLNDLNLEQFELDIEEEFNRASNFLSIIKQS